MDIQKRYCFKYLVFSAMLTHAQVETLSKTRILIGLSAPELFHAGIQRDLSKVNQIGFSAGVGPSFGTVWPTLNMEHRLYFGKIRPSINRRSAFLRQGVTFFRAEDQHAFTFSFGGDLKSKSRSRGWTIDIGVFFLKDQTREDRRNRIGPALRIQTYSYFKKNKQ